MKLTTLTALFFAASAGSLAAQTLTVEELRAQIDKRLTTLDPYQELLADPDPARSLAAMEIMLESGDKVLMDMAIDFGLLSNSPVVRRMAFEAHLATGPSITLRLDGSVTDKPGFDNLMRGAWRGSVDGARIASTTWKVGAFDDNQGCYLFHGYNACFIKISADGVTITGSNLSAQLKNDGSGQLSGIASLNGIPEPIPVTVDIVD